MINLLLKVFVLSLVCLSLSVPSFGAGYVDNKDGTVTDTVHGLMWQQGDDGVERSWQDAGNYCENLELAGKSDWRLPAINLLEGLIEPANSPTAPTAFSVKPSYYWSVSESHINSQSAKYVNFFYGNTYAYSKDNTYYVICVRETNKELSNSLKASFTHENDHGKSLEVHFISDIRGGSAPYVIEWDFGDGETASAQSPVHVFALPGSYKVSLTVSDNDGVVTSASQETEVSMPGAVVEETSLPSGSSSGADEKPTAKEDETISNDKAVSETTLTTAADTIKLGGEHVKAVEPAIAGVTVAEGKTSPKDISPSGQDVSSSAERGKMVLANPVSPTKEALGERLGTTGGKFDLPNGKIDNKTSLKPESAGVEEKIAPENETQAGVTPSSSLAAVTKPGPSLPFLELTVNGQNTAEINTLGHGLLGYALTNAIHGDADLNKDGIITSSELKGYLGVAVDSLSQGKVKPGIHFTGDDTGLCARQGSTYLLAAGVNVYHDDFTPRPFVEQDITDLQQALASRCSDTKTAVVTGEHANRAEFLQSLKKVGGMVGPNDRLIFYFVGLSERQGNRLNLLFNDTIKGMTAFTGLFYEDIRNFLKGVQSSGTVVLLETSDN